jgi:hypothetical protein
MKAFKNLLNFSSVFGKTASEVDGNEPLFGYWRFTRQDENELRS